MTRDNNYSATRRSIDNGTFNFILSKALDSDEVVYLGTVDISYASKNLSSTLKAGRVHNLGKDRVCQVRFGRKRIGYLVQNSQGLHFIYEPGLPSKLGIRQGDLPGYMLRK